MVKFWESLRWPNEEQEKGEKERGKRQEGMTWLEYAVAFSLEYRIDILEGEENKSLAEMGRKFATMTRSLAARTEGPLWKGGTKKVGVLTSMGARNYLFGTQQRPELPKATREDAESHWPCCMDRQLAGHQQ